MTQNLPDACRQYNRPLTTDHQRETGLSSLCLQTRPWGSK